MKKKYSIRLLITTLCIIMLSLNLKAQIEDFKVGSTTRQMLVYARSGIEPNCPSDFNARDEPGYRIPKKSS